MPKKLAPGKRYEDYPRESFGARVLLVLETDTAVLAQRIKVRRPEVEAVLELRRGQMGATHLSVTWIALLNLVKAKSGALIAIEREIEDMLDQHLAQVQERRRKMREGK